MCLSDADCVYLVWLLEASLQTSYMGSVDILRQGTKSLMRVKTLGARPTSKLWLRYLQEIYGKQKVIWVFQCRILSMLISC